VAALAVPVVLVVVADVSALEEGARAPER